MKKIVIFNHKGGVAKTTTCYHLGWSISETGKKVLLVDADSQCNLSMYALGGNKYESYYQENQKNDIYHALIPAFKSQVRLIEAVECPEVRRDLFLLPGHLDFTENEVQLGIAMQLSSSFGSMENLPGAINYLVEKTAVQYGIDYVIFDVNPSLSAINQDIFACCDFFMIPTSPDLFSLMAIKSLSRVLPAWERWAQKARDAFRNAVYPLPSTHPVFLGYTVNDFNLSNGQPQMAFQEFMKKISQTVRTELFPALKREHMTLPDSMYRQTYTQLQEEMPPKRILYPDDYCLAQISNFNRLIAFSNKQSLPVFEVVQPSGSTEGQIRTQQWFQELYPAFANRVLRLMSDEP